MSYYRYTNNYGTYRITYTTNSTNSTSYVQLNGTGYYSSPQAFAQKKNADEKHRLHKDTELEKINRLKSILR